jgi:CheY-like chemotaxis protein
LDLVLDPMVGNIKADTGQIEQAMFNLAVNARDAMPMGGRITIETANVYLDQTYASTHLGVRPGEYVMLSISDTGHGMDAETKNHIFEPFFTTKGPGKGTGLGLATVYGIVKQAGGDIWVYSEPGRGTTFKLYFPEVGEAAAAQSDTLTQRAGRGHETLLVVEDEEGVRNLLALMLRQQGYEVLTAATPNEAIEISSRYGGPIAMLVTDVVMPQMSGAHLAQELLQSRSDMRVLFMSGYTENAVVHHGVLDAGVEFIAKPVSQDALARKVRQILDK